MPRNSIHNLEDVAEALDLHALMSDIDPSPQHVAHFIQGALR